MIHFLPTLSLNEPNTTKNGVANKIAIRDDIPGIHKIDLTHVFNERLGIELTGIPDHPLAHNGSK